MRAHVTHVVYMLSRSETMSLCWFMMYSCTSSLKHCRELVKRDSCMDTGPLLLSIWTIVLGAREERRWKLIENRF